MKKFFLISVFLSLSFFGVSQKGPGGISNDASNATNCRLWLDASTLNQDGGTDVELWQDISVSSSVDEAFWDEDQDYLPPDFQSDPAAGINGKPTISFEAGGMLSIGTWDGGGNQAVGISPDLNSNPGVETTYEQSIFIAFRTSDDVTSRQILWEEGGSARGFIIFILDGTIRIGAYDDINDDDPGSGGGQGNNNGVRKFGFTWKELPVQKNATYVVSLVYNVPTNNEVLTNSTATSTTGLNGTLNGEDFPTTMFWGGQEWDKAGVGGVFTHPDPIGIGGLNRTSFNETGPVNLNEEPTGAFGFTGRLSEICYYAFAVSPCQRIIIENYLAAKYFATVIDNDRYEYQTSYGDGVIGIGKENDGDIHNVSQGNNLFEFRAKTFSSVFTANSPNYILTGHNGNSLNWTDDNVPDTMSTQRLRRVWRWDFDGPQISPTSPELAFRIKESDLPALPAGFSEYGIMVEKSNGVLPNFNESNSEIIGLTLNTSNVPYNYDYYEADVEIEDGTYLTLVAIRPQVQFTQNTISVIEGNNPPANQPGTSIFAELNFDPNPAITYSAAVSFFDDNADYGDGAGKDYYANGSITNNPVTIDFFGGITQIEIPITIVNDNTVVDDDPIERFDAIITSTSSNLAIGDKDTLNYRIFDNDPDPKASFQSDNFSFNEVDGTYDVPIEIIGTFTGTPTVTVRLVPNEGTATAGVDFEFASPDTTLTFTTLNPVQNLKVKIIDDDIDALTPYDEFDEWFRLEIISATGDVGFDNTVNIETQVNILDQDPEPTVEFQALSSEGYEGVSDPRIYVELSAPSAKQIVVPFSEIGGTAFNEDQSPADYAAEKEAILIIPPGEVESYIYFDIPTGETRLFVYSDGDNTEIAETILFELDETPGPTNAQLGTDKTHTFTIRDYQPFDNTGAAGVGKDQDNTFWIVADEAITGTPSSVPNLSPRPISVTQNSSSRRPSVTEDNFDDFNGFKFLEFDGSNDFLSVGDPSTLGQSSLINTAGQFDSKSIFIVFRPHSVTGYQTIYEQGGGARGISIYLKNNRLFFQVWNIPDDDGNATPNLSPWGHQSSNYAITQSSTIIQPNSVYIISAHYQNTMLPSVTTNEGLRLYVNGVKEDTYTGNVGRLYTHGGRAAVGCVDNGSYFDDGDVDGQLENYRCFDGDITEIVYFNEPNETRFIAADPSIKTLIRMNEPRIQIIHNYLAAKYDVTSATNLGSNELFDDVYTDFSSSTEFFGNNIAGIGRIGSSESHLDSKGRAELRVSSPTWTGNDAYLLWGHNNENLTNTWTFSNAGNVLPATINERSGKVWKFFERLDGIDDVQIEINFGESNNASDLSANKDLLRLLVHSNMDVNDFSNATVYTPPAGQPTGNVVRFDEVSVTDGMYIALGNTSDYFNFPLPIELLDFNARLNGPVVDLSWATATEVNNEKFIVERAGADLVWEEILSVPGAGNSSSTLYYYEKDRNPLKGVSYYRLKQVNYDGTYTYSDMVSVFNPGSALDDELSIYPNPSSGNSVFLRIPEKVNGEKGTIEVFDISGKTQLKKDFEELNSIEEIPHNVLPAGVYLVNLRSKSVNQTKKLVIQ